MSSSLIELRLRYDTAAAVAGVSNSHLLFVTANIRTGGRDPPPAQRGLKKIVVETLNNVGHHYAYRIERFWTPCGVSYIVKCLHKDVFKAHNVQGEGPGHRCVHDGHCSVSPQGCF